MVDEQTTEQPATPQQPTTTEQKAAEEAVNKYNGERLYFTPDKMADGVAKVKAITEQGIPVVALQTDWPEGAGMTIVPMTKRVEVEGEENKITKLYGVIAWPFYTFDMVLASEKGREVLQALWEAQSAQSIMNPLRKKEFDKLDDLDTSSVPKSLDEFLEGVSGERGVYKVFNELIKDALPKLKDMHPLFKLLTPPTIRAYLASKAMANSFNAEIEKRGIWVQILQALRKKAVEKQMNTEVFDTWLATRDEAEAFAEMTTLDLSTL